jgi:hypothetical protein
MKSVSLRGAAAYILLEVASGVYGTGLVVSKGMMHWIIAQHRLNLQAYMAQKLYIVFRTYLDDRCVKNF